MDTNDSCALEAQSLRGEIPLVNIPSMNGNEKNEWKIR